MAYVFCHIVGDVDTGTPVQEQLDEAGVLLLDPSHRLFGLLPQDKQYRRATYSTAYTQTIHITCLRHAYLTYVTFIQFKIGHEICLINI